MTRSNGAFAKAKSFILARGGNVSILFGFSLIPLVGLVGLGIDYGVGLTNKAKLDNAADAAAIAAVATAKAFVAANPTDPTLAQDAITAGTTQATNTFAVNAGTIAFASVPTPTVSLTRTGQTFFASVSYATTTKNHFGQIFGQPTFNVQGRAAASGDVPKYLDFYLMIDVSGSMGLPSTTAGQASLAQINQDMYSDYQQGCQFACHFPSYTGWNLAVSNNIQLRSGAVNSAVCSLIQLASQPPAPNAYRVGLYPFINQMATLSALSSDMTKPYAAADCGGSQMTFTNMLDTGTTQLATNNDPSTGTGSGGTHFEVAFPQMQSTIASFGDGSSALQPKPFVFLVTDGMENFQHYTTIVNGTYTYPGNPTQFPSYAAANWDGSTPAAIDPSVCTSLKNAGVTISILYIPYLLISYTPNGGGIVWEDEQVNSFSPTLPTPLQACASPGYFYTANSPSDITAALNAMFSQAVQVAHLTQ